MTLRRELLNWLETKPENFRLLDGFWRTTSCLLAKYFTDAGIQQPSVGPHDVWTNDSQKRLRELTAEERSLRFAFDTRFPENRTLTRDQVLDFLRAECLVEEATNRRSVTCK